MSQMKRAKSKATILSHAPFLPTKKPDPFVQELLEELPGIEADDIDVNSLLKAVDSPTLSFISRGDCKSEYGIADSLISFMITIYNVACWFMVGWHLAELYCQGASLYSLLDMVIFLTCYRVILPYLLTFLQRSESWKLKEE